MANPEPEVETLAALELALGDGESNIPQAEVEAELSHDATAVLMAQPPGPLKSSARLWWRHRCPSGPFEDDGEGGR